HAAAGDEPEQVVLAERRGLGGRAGEELAAVLAGAVAWLGHPAHHTSGMRFPASSLRSSSRRLELSAALMTTLSERRSSGTGTPISSHTPMSFISCDRSGFSM